MRKKDWAVLFIILAATAFTKIYRLGVPDSYYFDEIYHGFTAQEIVAGNKAIYDPWAKPPEGKAYEWTHPPLGKLIIAGTMGIFGNNFFSMRLAPAIFGTAASALVFFVALELTGVTLAALLATALVGLDGLLFAQSRIATIDTIFLFFLLLSCLFYVRWRKQRHQIGRLALAGLSLGLAASTKWSIAYFFALVGLDLIYIWFREKRKPSLETVTVWALLLFALPTLIYALSYIHYFALGYSPKQFVELQQQMWWYHTQLKESHGYQSVPWQWVLNLRPVWMYAGPAAPGSVINIYNLGNPVIFLVGFWCILKWIGRFWKQPNSMLGLGLAGYFVLWFPWIFSPRIMFSYHYLPAVPFLCIAMGDQLSQWFTFKRKSAPFVVACVITGLSAVWFAVFYPNLAAVPVSQSFAQWVYFLIPSWK